MEAERRELLVRKRASSKAALTRLQTFVDSFDGEMHTKIELRVRHDKLDEIWQSYNSYQNELEFEDDEASHALHREIFEAQYFRVKSMYLELLEPQPDVTARDFQAAVESTHCSHNGSRSQLKLPSIDLPKFGGNVEKWLYFKDTFEALIMNNPQLSNVQRFHYLLSSLHGEAHQLVVNLPITNDNLTIAWQLVMRRYHNIKVIVSSHIKQLLQVPTITKGSGASLRGLINHVQANVHALNALSTNRPWHEMLINQLIYDRIDNETRKEWELHSELDELPSLQSLIDFLERKCKACESITTVHEVKFQNQFSGNRKTLSKVQHTYVAVNSKCIVCQEMHSLYRCTKFANLNPQQRFNLVSQHKLCFNCLNPYAINHECSARLCRICNKRHHTMLHIDARTSQSTEINNTNSSQNSSEGNNSVPCGNKTYCTLNSNVQSQVLLGTALVTVRNKNGQYIHCRALLDSASQINFVTESMVQKLQLKKSKQHAPIQGINEVIAETKHAVTLNLKSRTSSYSKTIQCAVLPRITGTMPATYMDYESWGIPNDIILADEHFNQPGGIDLLIGAHVFYEILRPDKLTKPGNYPVLQDTELGWTIAGTTPIMTSEQAPYQVHFVQNEISLESQLQRFWEIESIEQPVLSREERQCEKHFSDHTTRQPDGRFVVRLPTKTDSKELGNSKLMAERRLMQIERRLTKDPELKTKYHAFMDEYLTMGHMELVKDDVGNEDTCFYLPHHPVFKASSTTTSTRVVFDASAKSTSGLSLNDILLTGPTIQQDLYSIVLRFRTHKIAIVADIAKMYRQILVAHQDQNLQRILWRTSPDENIQTFKLNTVTYGTACAPYLATRCLKQVAIDNELNDARSARIIKEDFYMDDLLTGCSTPEEAQQIYYDLSNLFKQAHFPLRKWSSNSRKLFAVIPEELRETQLLVSLDREKHVSTLGLLWDPTTDDFHVKSGIPSLAIQTSNQAHMLVTQVTKRRVLSAVASIFDPLGLLSPIVISYKMFLQSLWQEKIDWDEPLSSPLHDHWSHLSEQLTRLQEIKIPRCVLGNNSPTVNHAASYKHTADITTDGYYQIHGFCDSSERAYGACLYLRVTNAAGQTSCDLLCSKSKVAPLKKATLPRLELCGALLLANLYNKAIGVLNLKLRDSILWTDSTLVLHWLAGSSNKWKTFVGNRVASIQELTTSVQWRHVPSACNPADLISRGVEATTLKVSHLWWKGPKWLTQEPVSWPTLDISATQTYNVEEIKTHVVTSSGLEDWTTRYSTLTKLIRVTAYCRRFINNLRVNKEDRQVSSLTAKEIEDGLLNCVKVVQSISFHKEITHLSTNQDIYLKSKLISLTPFLDRYGFLRVGGRLQKSTLPSDAIHQLILPSDHHFTTLLLSNEHNKLLHAGPQLLIASIRQRFWILSIKKLVRTIIHRCIKCYRLKAQASQQLMGELPSQRVQPTRPFRNVGVDYAGPVILKIGTPRSKSTSKGYIAVFVCLATKAVHLEIVTNLTTDAFLAALRRFIGRRGKPSRIQSDNATNFKGAAHQLQDLYRLLHSDRHTTELQEVLSQDNCEWVFIPPHAPHFGGLWEAAVKSMKYHVKRVVGDKIMTYEELSTLLSQVEACMNSRPLCTIPNDPHEFNYLSPGHFLIGEPLTQIPSIDLCETSVSRLSRWQQVQQQLQQFWGRWHQDYLQELQQRGRWRKTMPNLQLGVLVLLREDHIPPLQWRVGIITDVHKGSDNQVRVVTVRTTSGTVKRPITKISVLPVC